MKFFESLKTKNKSNNFDEMAEYTDCSEIIYFLSGLDTTNIQIIKKDDVYGVTVSFDAPEKEAVDVFSKLATDLRLSKRFVAESQFSDSFLHQSVSEKMMKTISTYNAKLIESSNESIESLYVSLTPFFEIFSEFKNIIQNISIKSYMEMLIYIFQRKRLYKIPFYDEICEILNKKLYEDIYAWMVRGEINKNFFIKQRIVGLGFDETYWDSYFFLDSSIPHQCKSNISKILESGILGNVFFVLTKLKLHVVIDILSGNKTALDTINKPCEYGSILDSSERYTANSDYALETLKTQTKNAQLSEFTTENGGYEKDARCQPKNSFKCLFTEPRDFDKPMNSSTNIYTDRINSQKVQDGMTVNNFKNSNHDNRDSQNDDRDHPVKSSKNTFTDSRENPQFSQLSLIFENIKYAIASSCRINYELFPSQSEFVATKSERNIFIIHHIFQRTFYALLNPIFSQELHLIYKSFFIVVTTAFSRYFEMMADMMYTPIHRVIKELNMEAHSNNEVFEFKISENRINLEILRILGSQFPVSLPKCLKSTENISITYKERDFTGIFFSQKCFWELEIIYRILSTLQILRILFLKLQKNRFVYNALLFIEQFLSMIYIEVQSFKLSSNMILKFKSFIQEILSLILVLQKESFEPLSNIFDLFYEYAYSCKNDEVYYQKFTQNASLLYERIQKQTKSVVFLNYLEFFTQCVTS